MDKEKKCKSYCDKDTYYSPAQRISSHLKMWAYLLPWAIKSVSAIEFVTIYGVAGSSKPGLQNPWFGMENNI